MNFSTESLSANVSKNIRAKYLDTPEWEIEKIYKASKVAGPMAKWVES